MKRILTIALVASTMMASAQSWTVDTDNVSIEWNNTEKGHTGTFSELDAKIEFDVTSLEGASIVASINVKSLVADNDGLTKHLLSEDFFDADKYPKISFESESFEAQDGGFIVTGKLTVKDKVTDGVKIPFTFEDDTFKGEMAVNTGEIGIADTKSKKPNVTITISVPVTE